MSANAPTIPVPRSNRRKRAASIPRELRLEIAEHARSIAKRYRKLFAADRQLKDQVLRLERALLPPRPRRRGRPRNPVVTRAIVLYGRFRRQFPGESARQNWSRVYPLVIPGYVDMPDIEQRTAREELQERIAWRRRKRPRKKPLEKAVS